MKPTRKMPRQFMTAPHVLRAAVILLLLVGVSPAATLRVVVKDRVNFREGPGRNYPILDRLSGGDIVIQTNQTGEWIHVQRGNGSYGWVNGTMLAAGAGKPLLPDLQLHKRGNLRSAPTTKAEIVQLLEPPQLLHQIFQTGVWHAVITEDSLYGWVHDIIITEIPDSRGRITTLSDSNIRSGPGLGYDIIAVATTGKMLTPIARLADWYLIATDQNRFGWIYHSLVRIDFPGEEIAKTVRIRTNGHMRSGPGLNYPVVNNLSPGLLLPVDKQTNDWFHLAGSAALSGWFHRILIDTTYQHNDNLNTGQEFSFAELRSAIDSAAAARNRRNYEKAIRLYLECRPSIEQLYTENPADPCIRYYYAHTVYALAQHLHLEPNQSSAMAYRILQESIFSGECAERIRSQIRIMEEAVSIRSEVLSLFGNVSSAEHDPGDYARRAPEVFPLITEAEMYRLIGRYLALQKNNPAEAARWQQKSVILYQSLLKNGIELGSLGLENYFYALMESGVSQTKLGLDTGFDYFAKALELIEENQNNYWRNYYRRTLESLTR